MKHILLIPEAILNEISTRVSQISADILLSSYQEDDSPVEHLAEADAVIRWVAGRRFSDLVAAGPNVRWLHTASAGVDHVLTPQVLAHRGLVVTDSGTAFATVIPEFVIACIMSVSRRLPQLRDQQRQKVWHSLRQQDVAGKVLGIIGLGPIGAGTARLGKAIGMKTLGFRRRDLPVANVDRVLKGSEGLIELLAEADFIVIAAALTGESRGLIGTEELKFVKPTAWIINIARGDIIDEPALIEALESKAIAGACLDVFAQEPLPQESPLWTADNVFVIPHNSSGGTANVRQAQVDVLIDNIGRFVHGDELLNIVDKARGY